MASENLELELQKQFKASQEKYIYFLLAASASAIGFAMTQSKVEPLEWIHVPLGLSIVLWALSFISGLRFIEYSTSFTFNNQNYLAFKREIKSYPQVYAIKLLDEFKTLMSETSAKQLQKMKFYGNTQSISLLLGALSYIVWHTIRMWVVNA
ncbi:hypothetical protein [Aliarcobacter trophiarum]|uniref:hypothetical protein n=1 Tax=Aliarcobacter trophiarum TaxID=708186 RepID=UPI00100A8081|nr:hypothetical protein [Aliarcobacter trophiarum]RXI27659.1 hypothetical protein CRU89_05115 [Aliarcobacter trophiarum]